VTIPASSYDGSALMSGAWKTRPASPYPTMAVRMASLTAVLASLRAAVRRQTG
jgi:hypothetical protein